MIQKFKSPIKIKQGAKFNKLKCNNLESGNEIKITYKEKNKKTEDIYTVINTLTGKMEAIKTRAESIYNTLKPNSDPKYYNIDCSDLYVKTINFADGTSDLSSLFKILLDIDYAPIDEIDDDTNKIILSKFNEGFRGNVQKDNYDQCGVWLKILDFLIVVFNPKIPANNLSNWNTSSYSYFLTDLTDLEDYEIYNFPKNPKEGIYSISTILNSGDLTYDGFKILVSRGSITNYRGLDCQYIVVFKKKEHTNTFLDSSNFLIQEYKFNIDGNSKTRYENKYLKTQTQT